MNFYIIYDIKQDRIREKVYSTIAQNINAPFGQQEIRTPFFQSSPTKPDINSLPLNIQVERAEIKDNKLVIFSSLIIDVLGQVIKENNKDNDLNNALVVYES